MHNPFKALGKNKQLVARLRKRTLSPRPEKPVPDDEELFFQAVEGATPLTKGGRDVVPLPPQAPAPPAAKRFSQLPDESIEFDMDCSRECISGRVKGLDAKIFRKLRSGQFSIEAHLDLHGLNADQAQLAVLDFVRRTYMEGKRCVLIIPGRGRNSPLGQGVLRQELISWLVRAPLKRIVLAFVTAIPKHGGAGAVYLLLRQSRKGKGKIIWEDLFADIEA